MKTLSATLCKVILVLLSMLAVRGNSQSPDPVPSLDVTVVDATGKPAVGVVIKLYQFGKSDSAGAPLQESTVSPDGKLHLEFPPAAFSGGLMMNDRSDFPPVTLVAIDPTGQKQTLTFPSYGYKSTSAPNLETVNLALAPSTSAVPAFRGVIVGSDGLPVPGATFTYFSLISPGGGLKQFAGQPPRITSALDGSFSVGLPQDFLDAQLGVREIPSSSTLSIAMSGLVGYASLVLDKPNELKLPYTESLRVQLLDGKGNPLPNLKKGGVPIAVKQVNDNTEASADSNQWKTVNTQVKSIDEAQAVVEVGPVPLPGTYAVVVGDMVFPPRRLEAGASADTIQWMMKSTHATVTGRVLSAEDGAPLAGVYILSAFEQTAPHTLTSLTPEQLQRVWDLWQSDKSSLYSPRNPAALIVDKNVFLHGVDGMTRTDGNGSFTLDYQPGEQPRSIHAYLPDRMGATAFLYRLKLKNAGESFITLPDVSLPIAGAVSLTVLAPELVPDEFLKSEGIQGDKALQNALSAKVTMEDDGPWRVKPPHADSGTTNPWELISRTDSFSPSEATKMLVPAGVKFQVTATAPYRNTVGTAEWADVGPVLAGDTLELQPQVISTRIPFLVTVTKGDGTPVPGVGVRIDGHSPVTTDSQGSVIGWTAGLVKRIEVIGSTGWKPLAVKSDVTVENTVDPTQVILVIP